MSETAVASEKKKIDIKAFLSIIRPQNCIIGGLTVISGIAITYRQNPVGPDLGAYWLMFLYAFITYFFVAAGGNVVNDITKSFNHFWQSELTESIEQRFKGAALLESGINNDKVKSIYQELHTYAQSPENFQPTVRETIKSLSRGFSELINEIVWSDITFISDIPGKNKETSSLGGGGLATIALAELIKNAKEEIVIQSP